MIQRSRGVDQGFRPHHILFRRCTTEDVMGDRLIPNRIAHRNVSVNWSKYCKPWDVIFDFPGQGIVRIVVRCLPIGIPLVPADKNAKLHAFRPIHCPESENYSHTEIRAYRKGQDEDNWAPMGKADLPEMAKKEFRTMMADRSCVILSPKD
jgi:hypothetical protein